MANKKTAKSQYQSKYGGGFITAAQFITELICEHAARSTSRQLFDFFWDSPEWKKDFLAQLTHANKLLKQYTPEVIISVLLHPSLKYKKVTSLGAKWLLEPLFKSASEKEEILTENMCVSDIDFEAIDNSKVRVRPSIKKKNKLEGL